MNSTPTRKLGSPSIRTSPQTNANSNLPSYKRREETISGTFLIILICSAVWAAIHFTDNTAYVYLTFLSSHPFWLFGLPWLTSQFIHVDFAHLFVNLFFIYLCGSRLEKYFGKSWVLGLFLWGGMGSELAEWLLFKEPVKSWGASGGGFALLVAYLLYFPRIKFPDGGVAGDDDGIPSYFLLVYFIAPNILGVFFDSGTTEGISYFGHLGGAVIGFLASNIFELKNAGKYSIAPLFPRYFRFRFIFPIAMLLVGTLGGTKFLTEALIHYARIAHPSDPDYQQLMLLRNILKHQDERRLQLMVNALLVPKEVRPPGAIQAATIDELENLADRMDIPRENSEFQHFLQLYLNAPKITAQRRGYDSRSLSSQKTQSQRVFEAALEEQNSRGPFLMGGVTEAGEVILLTQSALFRAGAWYPVTTTKYQSSIVFDSEKGAIVIQQSKNAIEEISLNEQPITAWPVAQWDANAIESLVAATSGASHSRGESERTIDEK